MSIKRLAAAAAVATTLGMSATVFYSGFAVSDPTTTNPGPPGGGYGGTGSVPPPGSSVPGAGPKQSSPAQTTWSGAPKQTTAPAQTTWSGAPKQTTAPAQTTWTGPTPTTSPPWTGPTPTTAAPSTSFPVQCPSWHPDCTPAGGGGPSPTGQWSGGPSPTGQWSGGPSPTGQWSGGPSPTGQWGGSTPQPTPTGMWGQGSPVSTPWNGSPQPGPSNGYPSPVLHAPDRQPEHPPYYPPRGPIQRGNPQYGGPIDLVTGYWLPGQGAPLPPRPRGYGWNDGPAPGYAPPNWEGPPPVGGWNGPPPPGGWNRPWVGPPRDVSYGQRYFAPFTYNDFTAIPLFNWQYGGWGYWFDGLWIPLY
jgi:hypothetical protein